jgi:sterol desaturase/sphingolipid hydroxylase (fatty acid hydroxylase superfamily)
MGRSRPPCMETILGILIPLTFVALLILERVFPGREQPEVRGWLLKGIIFFVLVGIMASVIPAFAALLIGTHTLLNLRPLGTVVGGIVGFALADIASYGIHRLLHNVPQLWRWTHQMHHSAERVDIAGASYAHPVDNFIQGTVNIVAVLLLGLSPGAAALAGYISFFVGVFQHLNMRTPQWLGFIIQRPEAHSVHHTRGVHAYNYGNFMLWDLLFGTFRNPATFTAGPSGFWDGASSQVGAMLIGRDVGEPRRQPADAAAQTSPASAA